MMSHGICGVFKVMPYDKCRPWMHQTYTLCISLYPLNRLAGDARQATYIPMYSHAIQAIFDRFRTAETLCEAGTQFGRYEATGSGWETFLW